MERKGIIICGGSWLVDHNNVIEHWPEQETLTEIVAREFEGEDRRTTWRSIWRISRPAS